MANEFLFADDAEDEEVSAHTGTWKVVIVDDEPEVHAVTKLALSDFTFQGKPLEFISAYSGAEAQAVIVDHADAAIVLLDVVMETDDAGLNVARYIRDEAKNPHVRIILRTGQPGQAPERQVILNYDLNDYKSKTELTAQKLFTVIMASLRSYRDIISLEQSRLGLEKIIRASADLFSVHSMDNFIVGIIQQLTSILGCADEAMYITSSLVAGSTEPETSNNLTVFAGQGDYENDAGKAIASVLKPDLLTAVDEALNTQSIVYRDNYLVAYCSSKYTEGSLLYVSGIPEQLDNQHKQLIELFAQNVQIAYENVQLQCELEDTQREIVHRLSEAVEQRSSETGNHVKRVSAICFLLANAYGLSHSEAEILMHAAPLHDVGKIGIPDYILNKPDKLVSDEWEIMKTHAAKGFEILKESKRPIVKAGAIIARDHHERWDGTGYPSGKTGEDIHIYGRISALADVYDALRHKRCYKEAWTLDKVVELIQSESGKHFEPRLVDIFIAHLDELEHVLAQSP